MAFSYISQRLYASSGLRRIELFPIDAGKTDDDGKRMRALQTPENHVNQSSKEK